jgi:hypothetical protein
MAIWPKWTPVEAEKATEMEGQKGQYGPEAVTRVGPPGPSLFGGIWPDPAFLNLGFWVVPVTFGQKVIKEVIFWTLIFDPNGQNGRLERVFLGRWSQKEGPKMTPFWPK